MNESLPASEVVSAAKPSQDTTIVIAAFDAERFLSQCLNSIQAQTTPDWTCVIVDDGSKDGTAAIAARYAADDQRFSVVRQANGGVSAARNAGIQAAPPSAYMMFLDADDELEPDAVQSLAEVLDERPDAVGAFGIADYIDEQGAEVALGPTGEKHSERQRNRHAIRWFRTARVVGTADAEFGEIVTQNPVWPPAVAIFRRTVVATVGAFHTALTQCEDQDYVIRVTRRGPMAFIDQRIAGYRLHQAQATRAQAEHWYYSDAVRFAAYASSENSPAQRRAVVRSWRPVQARRVLRCGLRMVTALRHRDLRTAADRARGVILLVAQSLQNHPPGPSRRHIRLTGRG